MLNSRLATTISNMQEILSPAWHLLAVQKEGSALNNGKSSESILNEVTDLIKTFK